MLILPVLFFGSIAFIRLEVDDKEIRLRKFGRITKRVSFEAIGCSIAEVGAEKDWPLSLYILSEDRESVLMTVGLKMYRKKDVAWLLALPELKVERWEWRERLRDLILGRKPPP